MPAASLSEVLCRRARGPTPSPGPPCRRLADHFTACALERRLAAASIRERWHRPPVSHLEGDDMVTYVGLMTFTEKGIQTVKDSTKRAAAAREAGKKFGVNMREVLWTMGEFDLVSIIEA